MQEIDSIIASFASGSFVYTYYSYVEKFHLEPQSWQDLFEYLDFVQISNKVQRKLDSLEGK